MATTKKRINITLSKSTDKVLAAIAKRDGVPAATKAAELLDLALEIEEDRILGDVAAYRLKTNKGWIPLEVIEKKYLKK